MIATLTGEGFPATAALIEMTNHQPPSGTWDLCINVRVVTVNW